MTVRLRIELPPESKAVLERNRHMPERIEEAIREGMDEGAARTVSNIQESRLTGAGPFPVEEHRLGVGHKHGGRLRESLRYVPTFILRDSGNVSFHSAIGTNVVYAAIHEFGGVIRRTVRAGSVRLKTNKNGDLARNEWGGAIFAKRKAKNAREVSFAGGRTYTIPMPARSPFGFGLADNETTFTRAISKRLARVAEGGQL